MLLLFSTFRRYAGRAFFLAAFIAILVPSTVYSASAIEVGRQDRISLTQFMEYCKVDDGLTVSGVTGIDEEAWRLAERKSLNFGFPSEDTSYWFRFTLSNTSPETIERILEIPYPSLDSISLYIPQADGVYLVKTAGDRYPFFSRETRVRNFVFSLDIPPGVSTYHVRVKTTSALNFSPSLMTAAGYISKLNIELTLLWFYYGAMVMMIVYNFFLFAIMRMRSYLSLILFTILYIVSQAALDGIAFQYLWPGSVWWANNCIPFFMCLCAASSVPLIVSQTGSARLYPKTHKVLIGVVLIPNLLGCLCALSGNYFMAVRLAMAISIGSIPVLAALVVYMFFTGSRGAGFLLCGFLFFCVGIVITTLKNLGILPVTLITNWAPQFFSLGIIIFPSLGISDNVVIARNNLMIMNTELEKIVRERTRALRAANKKLEELSTIDGLTGVRNRKYFDDRFVREWKRAYRRKASIAVLMIDIDHFKGINDTFGHQAGDLCLQRVGAAIQEQVHRTPDHVARYGGEEFVVTLPGTEMAGALHVAETIRRELASLEIAFEEHTVRITASIGVAAQVPDDQEKSGRLVHLADKALYAAKQAGRNRVMGDMGATDSPMPAEGAGYAKSV